MAQTILIVDQDAAYLEQLRKDLLNSGYRVLCAKSQQEAQRILEAVHPDLIVTEILLERKDAGFCLAYHSRKKYPKVPIIILSNVTWHTGLFFNLAGPEERSWIKADEYLDKPIRFEELESTIRKYLPTARTA